LKFRYILGEFTASLIDSAMNPFAVNSVVRLLKLTFDMLEPE
jgi:hypothetical protein